MLPLLGKINANDYKPVKPTDCAVTTVIMSYSQSSALWEILDEK